MLSSRSWLRHGGALVQELVTPVGYDLRILVAAGEVVGAEERVAAPGEWRTNISLGGSYRDADAAPEACRLAVEAIAAIGLDFGGADLLPCPGGYVVVEVNGAVRLRRALLASRQGRPRGRRPRARPSRRPVAGQPRVSSAAYDASSCVSRSASGRRRRRSPRRAAPRRSRPCRPTGPPRGTTSSPRR